MQTKAMKTTDPYVLGFPDADGFLCWLAGPTEETRYYTPSTARRFDTAPEAHRAVAGTRRAYRIILESEMDKYTPPHLHGK